MASLKNGTSMYLSIEKRNNAGSISYGPCKIKTGIRSETHLFSLFEFIRLMHRPPAKVLGGRLRALELLQWANSGECMMTSHLMEFIFIFICWQDTRGLVKQSEN